MKFLILIYILLATATLFADTCNVHYLSSAQEEEMLTGKIEFYQRRIDIWRRRMDDDLGQSQIAARSQTRLFNFNLMHSTDNSKIYNSFMVVYRDVEESYILIQNYKGRIQKLEKMLTTMEKGKDLSKASMDYLADIDRSLANGAKPHDHVRSLIRKYEGEIVSRNNRLIERYDDFNSLEYTLKNVLAGEMDDVTRQQYEHVAKTLRLKLSDVESRRFQFKEQIEAGTIPHVDMDVLRKYFDSDLRLKKSLWFERYADQVNGIVVHYLFKLRLHEQLFSYLNRKMTASNPGVDWVRKVMAKVSNKLVDHQMINKYSSRIARQLEPGMKVRSIADQFEVMVSENALSQRPDEYLIALARSVDSKMTWRELVDHANDNKIYPDMFARMQKAEKEAQILGDLRIPEKLARATSIGFLTLSQYALAFVALEAGGVIDFIPDRELDPKIDRVLNILKDPNNDPQKTREVLKEIEKKADALKLEE